MRVAVASGKGGTGKTLVSTSLAWLLAREQLVVEASGDIAIAPLLNGQLSAAGRQVVALLTGRNIDATLLNEIVFEQGGR